MYIIKSRGFLNQVQNIYLLDGCVIVYDKQKKREEILQHLIKMQLKILNFKVN